MFFSGPISRIFVFGDTTQLFRLYSQNKHAQNDETVTLGIYLLAENQQVAYIRYDVTHTNTSTFRNDGIFHIAKFADFFCCTKRKCNKFDEEGKWGKKN